MSEFQVGDADLETLDNRVIGPGSGAIISIPEMTFLRDLCLFRALFKASKEMKISVASVLVNSQHPRSFIPGRHHSIWPLYSNRASVRFTNGSLCSIRNRSSCSVRYGASSLLQTFKEAFPLMLLTSLRSLVSSSQPPYSRVSRRSSRCAINS